MPRWFYKNNNWFDRNIDVWFEKLAQWLQDDGNAHRARVILYSAFILLWALTLIVWQFWL